MKKLISVILSILFLFLHCDARGYDVEYLPDGGKKITYTYTDLQQLSDHHKQLLSQLRTIINAKRTGYARTEVVSSVASLACIVIGAILCVINARENKGTSGEDTSYYTLPGAILCVLGTLGLISVPLCLRANMKGLLDQERAVDLRILAIDTTKQTIDAYISDGLIREDVANKEFYHTLFVDKYGFVYQIETGGASMPYELVELETRYKLFD